MLRDVSCSSTPAVSAAILVHTSYPSDVSPCTTPGLEYGAAGGIDSQQAYMIRIRCHLIPASAPKDRSAYGEESCVYYRSALFSLVLLCRAWVHK